jgi:hypothetical protein
MRTPITTGGVVLMLVSLATAQGRSPRDREPKNDGDPMDIAQNSQVPPAVTDRSGEDMPGRESGSGAQTSPETGARGTGQRLDQTPAGTLGRRGTYGTGDTGSGVFIPPPAPSGIGASDATH